MTHAYDNARKGFTLIELMIAIAVLAIISVVVIPNALKYYEDAKRSKVNANLLTFKSAITQFQLQMGQLPTRLKDLIKVPSDEKLKKKWTGSFVESKEDILDDPWGNKYQYKVSPAGAPHPYELYSYGKNGKEAPQSEWINVWEI